jgi:hypothetical protein
MGGSQNTYSNRGEGGSCKMAKNTLDQCFSTAGSQPANGSWKISNGSHVIFGINKTIIIMFLYLLKQTWSTK